MKGIKYVQLEPAGFLTDIDFQLMNAEERGVYCSIIFFLLCNEGKLKYSETEIRRITNCSAECNLDFALRPFQIIDGFLSHKWVTAELKKGKKLFDSRSRRGPKSPNWRGGPKNKSRRRIQMMNRFEYKQWRTCVFCRDNFTCQKCGQRGWELEAHHKKPYSTHPLLRLEVNNGMTLCKSCHRSLHKRGSNAAG